MGKPHEYSTSLRRRPEGPLTPYIDAFLRLLSTQGYSRASILLYTRLVADFSRWLKNRVSAEKRLRPITLVVTSELAPALREVAPPP